MVSSHLAGDDAPGLTTPPLGLPAALDAKPRPEVALETLASIDTIGQDEGPARAGHGETSRR